MALTQIWCNSLMSRRKGKVHKPYEFGVKVSVATTINRSKGGQFVTHIQALPGKPCDGHTLETVVPAIEAQVGAPLSRIIADAGYKGHNAPQSHRFRVYTAGQKRGMSEHIKRQMRRHSAIEPVIGHLKEDHRMGRNHLTWTIGDAANAILAAVGYNFRRILAWIRFCIAISGQFWRYPKRQTRSPPSANRRSSRATQNCAAVLGPRQASDRDLKRSPCRTH
ncbi:hypothetical protein HFN66_30240 [Rhizobium laguerreae]|nr:hypothetical protein [Rhizobium laguerreae]MBY3403834.1 hypothetical protein [Rhizobium laguerreae]MBY3516274.1 hypothetical protein [Rhizobium laguerreae]MBY3561948.1 hypothetical protein [Rhizobium laguerreae]